MLSLEEKLKKRVEAGDIDLPVLPAVSAEVMALTQNEDSDAKQLSQLIQNDQALAGHVMRMANSAAYNSLGQIQTLQQAIAKLGMRQIGQMALTISVGQSVFKSTEPMQKIIEYLWKHALASAAWSRELARIGRTNTEMAFLCGLLHQIGKPVAINTLAKILSDSDKESADQSELLAITEKYNQIIGVSLARRWQLPESVIESINYIDDYYAAPTAKQEVMTVNAASILASNILETKQLKGEWVAGVVAENTIFEELNLYEDDVDLLVEKSVSVNDLLQTLKI